MTRRLFALVAACSLFTGIAAAQPAPARKKPKLVVGIVIDQFRYDYLTRFRSDYSSGFERLLTRGAVFTNARYEHFPTVTAIGHSTFMSGALPGLSGIVENTWYDRETGKDVTSVSDPATKLLGGGDAAGASPRRLVVSTIGDELKNATRGKSRVVGMSIKDRAAILPAGRRADGAYWFDAGTGHFVSSTFYFTDLPDWVKKFNAERYPDRFANAEWRPLTPSPDYPDFSKRMPAAPGRDLYNAIESAPYASEMLEAFAERAIETENLGRNETTDLLTISFSANDYVGHAVGPDAPEVRDMSIRTDRIIGRLLDFIDKRVGLDQTLVVLTGDHGVAPLAEVLVAEKMPGGRLPSNGIADAVQAALTAQFGEGKWVAGWSGDSAYLNRELIASKKLREADVEEAAADTISRLPHVFRVYTRDQFLRGAGGTDAISRKIANSFFPSRSGDLFVVLDPYWIPEPRGATHGSPFMYDSHVPVIFMGAGIVAGRYDATVAPNDIAPTLATALDIETPSGAMGRVLSEIFRTQ